MKPITPQEVDKTELPNIIIEIINKLIVKNFDGESAWIEEETIISRIIDATKYKRSEIFDKGWMNDSIIRLTYKNAGWKVRYGYYSTSYKFIFTKR